MLRGAFGCLVTSSLVLFAVVDMSRHCLLPCISSGCIHLFSCDFYLALMLFGPGADFLLHFVEKNSWLAKMDSTTTAAIINDPASTQQQPGAF